ncbi:NUDIX hydrolase [Nitrogeniibacter mangrovi]|uniref:NUDIX hydrolase n=1 Tax=Nitrogeniibacter mangrovi TaxID=2016596 RepID=A0A6C1B2P9_9RHOO|nr:NUDIX domain-containing protein [Nitrogeniibacter mangrovi]QID17837.1 NUDIX hydrolase [Nitrogeniibacter mangrovi]
MPHYHPKKNEQGKPVELEHPSQPTPPATWQDPAAIATVAPEGAMPDSINGIALRAWADAPTTADGWEQLAAATRFDEPDFNAKKSPASGVVIVEPDGRIWIVSPSNQFGGYINTFPKGKQGSEKLSLKATALKEAFEESGLQVELIAHLCDVERTTSTTRYYLARRIAGNPSEMGWESQAVHLVPRDHLAAFVSHTNDLAVLEALDRKLPTRPMEADIVRAGALAAGFRILATVNGFRRQFGSWPTQLRIYRMTAEGIKRDILTDTGWLMLEAKMRIALMEEASLFAHGDERQFEYDGVHDLPTDGERADRWIWKTDFSL